jgi:hypothetical protein
MTLQDTFLLAALVFAAALLYSSVGHAGASGYLAAMALFSLAPDVMRPAALVMNILVATITTVQFYRAGCFSWRLFWPFAITSVPFAFLGGLLTLPGLVYKQVVGVILLLAAVRLFLVSKAEPTASNKPMPLSLALFAGAGLGLLSGLTGTGGGIFLSPLLLFTGWADMRKSGGVSAAFILVNSLSGLLGLLSHVPSLPNEVSVCAATAVAGGLIGSTLGSRRLGNLALRRLLAVVLVIAGLKLMLT